MFQRKFMNSYAWLFVVERNVKQKSFNNVFAHQACALAFPTINMPEHVYILICSKGTPLKKMRLMSKLKNTCGESDTSMLLF